MKPIFTWIGGKSKTAEDLVSMIPKHKIYVEPFFGGGAIFFRKSPSEIEVLNDLNKGLIQAYKQIQKAPSGDYPQPTNPKELKRIYKNPRNNKESIIKILIKYNLGFRGVPVRDSDHIYLRRPNLVANKVERIPEIKERLKHAILLSGDYKDIILETDSKDTFFYLDPPYENSKSLYKHHLFDYSELASILRHIKGKFILSINDSDSIRKLFRKFHIYQYNVRNDFDSVNKKRSELFISNF